MDDIENKNKQYKIVVVSDSHGDTSRLERLLPIINSADYFVFCGDGAADVMRLRGRITVPIVCVKGNNDFWLKEQLNDSATVTFGGAKALVTHGHKYGARQGITTLLEMAKLNDYKIVFFGHTHKYTDVIHSGIHFINSGALCNGSYAIVTYDGQTFVSQNCFIK
ncbi:MAG: YfcE family phosphodiesterase [Clostridiales bacterium]|nr:YfcE family phosphodiesterase [Clostridiales bacterium]